MDMQTAHSDSGAIKRYVPKKPLEKNYLHSSLLQAFNREARLIPDDRQPRKLAKPNSVGGVRSCDNAVGLARGQRVKPARDLIEVAPARIELELSHFAVGPLERHRFCRRGKTVTQDSLFEADLEFQFETKPMPAAADLEQGAVIFGDPVVGVVVCAARTGSTKGRQGRVIVEVGQKRHQSKHMTFGGQGSGSGPSLAVAPCVEIRLEAVCRG